MSGNVILYLQTASLRSAAALLRKRCGTQAISYELKSRGYIASILGNVQKYDVKRERSVSTRNVKLKLREEALGLAKKRYL